AGPAQPSAPAGVLVADLLAHPGACGGPVPGLRRGTTGGGHGRAVADAGRGRPAGAGRREVCVLVDGPARAAAPGRPALARSHRPGGMVRGASGSQDALAADGIAGPGPSPVPAPGP